MTIVKQQIKDYINININTRHPNWEELVHYDFGDIVFYDHYYFRNVIDDNHGITPIEDSPEWLLWDISNRYAQIDLHATTSTIWNSTSALVPTDNKLVTEFSTNNYNIVALGRVKGGSVKIEILDGGGAVVHTETKTSYSRPSSNTWYNYYFDPFENSYEGSGKHEAFYFRIPPIKGTVRVTVDAVNGVASVGFMIGGYSKFVGDTLFGVSTGIEDNSIWKTGDFGITSVIERDASESLDLDVQYAAVNSTEVKINVRDIVGEIVLFIGDEDTYSKYDHLMILGKVDSFTPVISNPIMTKASFSVSEII